MRVRFTSPVFPEACSDVSGAQLVALRRTYEARGRERLAASAHLGKCPGRLRPRGGQGSLSPQEGRTPLAHQ